jgi:putative flippase GtrA
MRDGFVAFIRYAVIGIAQNLLFYGITLAALYLGFAAWQAILILYPVAAASSFAANRLWSFAGHKRTPMEFQKYLVVYALTYPIVVGLTWAQEQFGIRSYLASLITLLTAAVGIFLVLNYWVFAEDSEAANRRY